MLPDALRSLPYLVHTNRELGLMLRGSKPLAYFGYLRGNEPDCMLRYFRMFDRHVSDGRFIKRVETEEVSVPYLPYKHFDRWFYALPDQAWRISAMLSLLHEPGAWSDDREGRFGSLLGYEDWQNDFWLRRVIANQAS